MMPRSTTRTMLYLALLLGAALPCVSHAASARSLVAQGNQAYRDGKYAEALEAYEEAGVDLPESPQLAFNRGAACYKSGDYAKAREHFEKGALKTRDLTLEARCTYNLGNCSFQEGERQKDSDLEKALAAYQASVRYYQEALKRAPQLTDAAHNIEVARLVMRDILDKLKKKQEEEKEKQKEQQKLLDQLKQLIERQAKAIEQNQALAEKQATEPKAIEPDVAKLADEQGDIRKGTGEVAQKLAQPLPQGQQRPPQLEQAKQHLDRATAEQAVAEEHLRKQKLGDARPGQDKALDEMKKALAALAGKQPPNQGQQPKQQPQQPQPQPQQQTAKPKDERAKDILNEEKENRERRRVGVAGGQRPVDKDW